MIYLDNAATTEPCAEAIVEYVRQINNYGNASSMYAFGKSVRDSVEEARVEIAKVINAEPDEIFFTSGGTESNNWALRGFGDYTKHIVSWIEHPSVLTTATAHDETAEIIPVDEDCVIRKDLFEETLDRYSVGSNRVVSVMLANNETGAIQPIKELAEIAHKRDDDTFFHTDAVQALGHMKIDVKDLGVDMLSGSSHKFHGLKGTGFLYVKKDIQQFMIPLMYGGHQENGFRAGTYNAPGITSMAKALSACTENLNEDMKKLVRFKKFILNYFDMDDNCVNGKNTIPTIMSLKLGNGLRSEEVLALLDQFNVYISAGSACMSASLKPSHVLTGMHLSEEDVSSTIRIGLSKMTTMHEINGFCNALENVINYLKGR